MPAEQKQKQQKMEWFHPLPIGPEPPRFTIVFEKIWFHSKFLCCEVNQKGEEVCLRIALMTWQWFRNFPESFFGLHGFHCALASTRSDADCSVQSSKKSVSSVTNMCVSFAQILEPESNEMDR